MTGPFVSEQVSGPPWRYPARSEEHTSELQSHSDLVCRLLLEWSRDHPVLHSFPTRRSSDLGSVAVAGWLDRRLFGFGLGLFPGAEMREHRDGGNQEIQKIELHDRAFCF